MEGTIVSCWDLVSPGLSDRISGIVQLNMRRVNMCHYSYSRLYTRVNMYIIKFQVKRGGRHGCSVLGPRSTWGKDLRLSNNGIFL